MPADRRSFLKSSAIVAGASTLGATPMTHAESHDQQHPEPASFEAKLLQCLGGPWPDPCDLQPRFLREEQRDGYRLRWVDYAVEPDDRVPAILLIPDGVTATSPAPAIAIWHQHAGQWHLGKSEPAVSQFTW